MKTDYLVSDVDECELGIHTCDKVNGQCTNTYGSYQCSCIQGFHGNGSDCASKLLVQSSSLLKLKIKSKSNLHHTRGIALKCVTSGGAHLRSLTPGQHRSEETSQQ